MFFRGLPCWSGTEVGRCVVFKVLENYVVGSQLVGRCGEHRCPEQCDAAPPLPSMFSCPSAGRPHQRAACRSVVIGIIHPVYSVVGCCCH